MANKNYGKEIAEQLIKEEYNNWPKQLSDLVPLVYQMALLSIATSAMSKTLKESGI